MVIQKEIWKQDTNRKAGAIIISKDNYILVVHQVQSPNKWGLPKGRVRINETDFQAMVREVHQETGINVLNNFVFQTPIYIKRGVVYIVKSQKCKDDIIVDIRDKDEIQAWKWINLYSLIECIENNRMWNDYTQLFFSKVKQYPKLILIMLTTYKFPPPFKMKMIT